MRRWLTLGWLVACGCSEGQLAPSGMDAGRDAGETLGRRQWAAASALRGEMYDGSRAMLAYIDARRGRDELNGDGVAMFDAALRAYRTPSPAAMLPDAGQEAVDAYVVRYTLSVVAPLYCRVIDAYRAATGQAYAEPRVRCSELPSPPDGWWTRYE